MECARRRARKRARTGGSGTTPAGGGAPASSGGGAPAPATTDGDGGGAEPLPLGPAPLTYIDLFTWPMMGVTQGLERIPSLGKAQAEGKRTTAKAVLRLQRNAREVLITTSYSGIGCAETAVAMVKEALQLHGIDCSVRFYRARDMEPLCQHVLLHAHKGAFACEHVMGDILDDLDPRLRARLDNYRESLLAGLRARCRKGGISQEDKAALMRRRGEAFRAKASELLQKEFMPQVVEPLQVDQLVLPRDAVAQTFNRVCTCFRHGAGCPVFPKKSEGQLWVEIAGSTCVAWSSLGDGEGWLHEASLPCLTWAWECVAARPDVVIHECTRHFDGEGLASILRPHYTVESKIITPTQWGLPAQRQRKYTVALLQESGNMGCHSFARDFLQLFGRECKLTGEVYFAAPERVQQEYYRSLAEKRQYDPASTKNWGIADVLAPSYREIAKRYSNAAPRDAQACSIVDLSQDPSRLGGRSPPSHMPALVKNSHMFHVQSQRLLLPEQHFVVMGFPAVRLWTDREEPKRLLKAFFAFRWDIHRMLRRCHINDAQVGALTGNGMHLSQVGLVFLFVLLTREAATVEPRSPQPDVATAADTRGCGGGAPQPDIATDAGGGAPH